MGEKVHIDRLTVEVGVPAEEGQRLALAIVAGMASAGGMPEAGDISSLRVVVATASGATTNDTVRRAVAETMRQLRVRRS